MDTAIVSSPPLALRPFSSFRFLFVPFVQEKKFGIGAQLVSLANMLAIALNEGRVMVLGRFKRNMHEGCEGNRGSWTCLFAPETSAACKRCVLFPHSSTFNRKP